MRSAAALVLPVLPERVQASPWSFQTARMHGALFRPAGEVPGDQPLRHRGDGGRVRDHGLLPGAVLHVRQRGLPGLGWGPPSGWTKTLTMAAMAACFSRMAATAANKRTAGARRVPGKTFRILI